MPHQVARQSLARAKREWSREEVYALIDGVKKYGSGSWKRILRDKSIGKCFQSRSNINIKDKWRQVSCWENISDLMKAKRKKPKKVVSKKYAHEGAHKEHSLDAPAKAHESAHKEHLLDDVRTYEQKNYECKRRYILKASELDVLYKTALDFRDQVPNAMPIVSQAMKAVHDAFVAEEKAISFEYVAEKAEMKYLQWKRNMEEIMSQKINLRNRFFTGCTGDEFIYRY